jgi:hypothetical protein
VELRGLQIQDSAFPLLAANTNQAAPTNEEVAYYAALTTFQTRYWTLVSLVVTEAPGQVPHKPI